MQELKNAKYSNAYLNGIKDSLNPNALSAAAGGGADAIQDLLRAASLLGGFNFGASFGGGHTEPTTSSANKNSSSSSAREATGPAKETNKAGSNPPPENGQEKSGNGKTATHDDHTDDSDSMEEDDSMVDSDDGWAGTGEGNDESRKRGGGGGGGEERPSKRRRFVSDESALRVPLAAGWKRETLIRSIGKSGVRGEVTYYSPSGRRFRQYPDVVRYLERQGIGAITRDNFSFSTRCIVGEFVQPVSL